MRIMRIEVKGEVWLAASRDGFGWLGLPETDRQLPGPMSAQLASSSTVAQLAESLLRHGAAIEPEAHDVLPPVPLSGRILCIGLNYTDHVAETGLPTPEDITVFLRTAGSFVGHGAPLVRPLAEASFDYEAELAAIIGAPARRISRTNALSHVAGYTLLNDGSIRDAQMRSSQWTLGKNYDATGSIGPCLVLPGALPQGGRDLRLMGKLNGDIVQDGNTSDMVFDLPRIIEELSAVMTLAPGDVIATGTPAGVAMGSASPRWLRPGDRFEVIIEGIGTLSNEIVDEADLRLEGGTER